MADPRISPRETHAGRVPCRIGRVEAFTARLRFDSEGEQIAEYLLKPYLYPDPERVLRLPDPCQATRCHLQLKLSKSTKSVHFTAFRAVVESPENDGRLRARPGAKVAKGEGAKKVTFGSHHASHRPCVHLRNDLAGPLGGHPRRDGVLREANPPVLAEHCYECHGPEKQKAELRLDSREAILKGSESGRSSCRGTRGRLLHQEHPP